MDKSIIPLLLLLFTSFHNSYCSTEYSAEDMIVKMNQYLDDHSSVSYYMTIDPDNLLDEIDHKLLDKYQNLIYDRYNIVTLILVANGFINYGNGLSSFLKSFYEEFNKTLNIQNLKCIVTIISVSEYSLIMDSTKKIKNIFNDNILNGFLDKMKITLNQNHLFLTIYELLKNIEKAQKQFNEKGIVNDL